MAMLRTATLGALSFLGSRRIVSLLGIIAPPLLIYSLLHANAQTVELIALRDYVTPFLTATPSAPVAELVGFDAHGNRIAYRPSASGQRTLELIS